MLFLLFELDRDRYAIESAHVIEVLPLVELKKIPRAPSGIAGLFNYRGEPVPVVDVPAMLLRRPARRLRNTRLLVVRQPDGRGGERPLGLLVERAMRTFRCDPADFQDSGVALDGVPCLGPVAMEGGSVVQWVDPRRLLSDAVRDVLFRPTAEAAS